MIRPFRSLALFIAAAVVTTTARGAAAQSLDTSAASRPAPASNSVYARSRSMDSPWTSLFSDTVRDLKRLPTQSSGQWLVVGAIVAAGARAADTDVTRVLSRSEDLHDSVRPGQIIGSSPFQLGAAVATYAIGKTTRKPELVSVGADLFRADLISEGLTLAIKQSVRRDRPEGSGFSFPSGHTTVTFASATVLQRHFGWKVGIPAYAVATYVGVSRVQMQKHYLSDVAFGAALGVVAGHTVTMGLGNNRRVEIAPMATPGGGGVSFNVLNGSARPQR